MNRMFLLIKKILCKIINLFIQYNSVKIINRIKKYNYVSFDIFDTLVKRCVAEPSDLFIAVAKNYNSKYNQKIDPNVFKIDRVLAEKKAREKFININKQEIRLEEIYNCFDDKYDVISKRRLKLLEIEREVLCCHKNYIIGKVFDWCKNNRKKIIIVSDTYLSRIVIERILTKCGYINYDGLYISSEYGLVKVKGGLFKFIINDLNINVKDYIHIGDNIRADFFGAKKSKVSACLIANNNNISRFCRIYMVKNKKNYKKLKRIINNCADPSWNEYASFGYEVLGPIVYSFCNKLHILALKNNEKKLFFVSRDGYMLMKMYNYIYKEEAIENKYIYLSRKVLSVANLYIDSSLENLIKLQGNGENKRWTYREISSRCGINEKIVLDEWKNAGLQENDFLRGKELLVNKLVLKFYKELELEVKINAKMQFNLIKKYFSQEEFVGKVAIVDSGGYATCQRMLEKIADYLQGFSIYGYYMWKYITKNDINMFISFPFGNLDNNFFSTFFEAVLSSNEGTVTKFNQIGNERVVPVVDDYEYDNSTIKTIEYAKIGIFKFIDDMLLGYDKFVLSDDVVISNYMSFVLKPRKKDLVMLKNFVINNDNEKTYAIPQHSFVYYVKNIKKLLYDYSASNWKEGFLKYIFKIPLPYNKIVSMMHCFRKCFIC